MSRQIIYHDEFDSFDNIKGSRVFEVFPSVFNDNRGYFCEVMKGNTSWSSELDGPIWFNDSGWIRQINRSMSKGKTIRGCHAQKGVYCQAKLVQALTAKIYDIITDARPNSNTFGVSQVFILDPEKQNQLWVPKGFLHSFATVDDKPAVFEYFCDAIFNKESETGVNPLTLLPNVVNELQELSKSNSKLENDYFDLFMLFNDKDNLVMSKKDIKAEDYQSWMKKIEEEYIQTRKLWYL